MKKLIVITVLLFIASSGYCVTKQPHNIGYVATDSPLGLYVRTIAQIDALTADVTNQILVCSDCVESKICVSTGSVNAGSWVVASGTATAAVGGLIGHCK